MLAPNGPDWVVWWLAVTRIGAVMVPLNTFYKPRELGYVLRHADASALLTVARFLGNDYLERLEAARPGSRASAPARSTRASCRTCAACSSRATRAAARWAAPLADLEAAADAAPAIDAAFLAAVEACVTPADPMVVIYSSGSTADPKGAVHSHGAPLRHAFNTNQFRDIEPSDRIFSPMPFFWVGGLVFTLISRDARGRVPALRGGVRARRDARAARARARHDRGGLAALLEGAGGASELRVARPVLDARRQSLRGAARARRGPPIPSCARTRSA